MFDFRSFLTLKTRMRGLVVFSITILLASGGFGYWQFLKFREQYSSIQSSSGYLQHHLESTFQVIRLLDSVHSKLRQYMHTADPAILASLKVDVNRLRKLLDKNFHTHLDSLQKIVNVLSIRMKSLHENDEQIPIAQHKITNLLVKTQKILSPKDFSAVYTATSNAMTQYNRLYMSSLVTGDAAAIDLAMKSMSKIFMDLEERLSEIMNRLPDKQKVVIKELKDSYYLLDDAKTTVVSIKLTTWKTATEVVNTINNLRAAIADSSIESSRESFMSIARGLATAKKNIFFLVSGLIVLALIMLFVSYLISTQIIQPIVEFVNLLRNLGRMMTGQRMSGCRDEGSLRQLSDFIEKRHDEIGEVAVAIRDMLAGIHAISFFRHTIEADENTSDIYMRLAKVFKQKLGFDTFVIYERPTGQPGMEPAYCSPPELSQELPEFSMAGNCRAKRTGSIITSYDDRDICTFFPFPDCLDHYCIPMIVGGHIIGVVQFLFSREISPRKRQEILYKIEEARKFINETLPVLQSKHLAAELEEMATRDQLTGLFNRRYLESTLDQIVAGVKRRGTHLGILMCDLDYFKEVNDTYGHDGGDDVLRQLAQVLLNSVRSSDIVIRFGGEEFIVILVDCEVSKIKDVAETIRLSVEKNKFQAGGNIVTKTISIGVSEFPLHTDQGIWEAIKFADVALYKAKENGRNRVEVFDQSMWKESSY